MARRFVRFADVPDDRKIWHPDGRRFIHWYVAKDDTDLYDDDTSWDVHVWDRVTGDLLYSGGCNHKSGTAGTSGRWLERVCWSDDGASVELHYRGAPAETEPVGRTKAEGERLAAAARAARKRREFLASPQGQWEAAGNIGTRPEKWSEPEKEAWAAAVREGRLADAIATTPVIVLGAPHGAAAAARPHTNVDVWVWNPAPHPLHIAATPELLQERPAEGIWLFAKPAPFDGELGSDCVAHLGSTLREFAGRVPAVRLTWRTADAPPVSATVVCAPARARRIGVRRLEQVCDLYWPD